jgi:DNA-directed RNA polymerase specialized sigma24 family protein
MGWINTIALNRYRQSGAYEARFQTLSDEEARRCSEVDLAALDVAKIPKSCRPRDRALFEFQLGGLGTCEIARKHGVTETAIQLRFLRARREVRENLDARAAVLRELHGAKIRAAV